MPAKVSSVRLSLGIIFSINFIGVLKRSNSLELQVVDGLYKWENKDKLTQYSRGSFEKDKVWLEVFPESQSMLQSDFRNEP